MSTQSTLTFTPITAHDAQLQRARIAAEVQKTPMPVTVAASTPPQRRPVGRPKKARKLEDAVKDESSEKKQKRGSYSSNWFSSPYINDILEAYHRRSNNVRSAVSVLQKSAPDTRYDDLKYSTVAGWFSADHKLLPQYQRQYDDAAKLEKRGRPRLFQQQPEVEAKVIDALTRMREMGTSLNIPLVRHIFIAAIKLLVPNLLIAADPAAKPFQLSKTWISRWVREKLNWRWRKSTTAASKLPNDWEEQGIGMAKRIAAVMGMHKVSTSGGA
jgi:hypothetical protein